MGLVGVVLWSSNGILSFCGILNLFLLCFLIILLIQSVDPFICMIGILFSGLHCFPCVLCVLIDSNNPYRHLLTNISSLSNNIEYEPDRSSKRPNCHGLQTCRIRLQRYRQVCYTFFFVLFC